MGALLYYISLPFLYLIAIFPLPILYLLSDIMYVPNLITLDTDVEEARMLLVNEPNANMLPVIDDNNEILGVVTMRDLAEKPVKEDLDKLLDSYDTD